MLGSNANWQSLYVDVRKYIHFTQTRQQNMLALWTYYWTTLDKGVPYLDLPSIGWDFYNRSGRGIQQNRYRGQSLAYMEAEYRRDILPSGLLGFVLFANSTSVSRNLIPTSSNTFIPQAVVVCELNLIKVLTLTLR
jgi:hypothetical protein